MAADDSVCALCFEPAHHDHHLSGRDPSRRRLDDDLTVALCRPHHVLVHEHLRTQRLDRAPREGWNDTARLTFVLARLAVFFGVLSHFHDEPLWSRLAEALRTWAHLLTTPNND